MNERFLIQMITIGLIILTAILSDFIRWNIWDVLSLAFVTKLILNRIEIDYERTN